MSGISYILTLSEKIKFLQPPVDRYLLNTVSSDRHMLRDSKKNVLSVTITGNVTISR